jgi:WD40 repeat protein
MKKLIGFILLFNSILLLGQEVKLILPFSHTEFNSNVKFSSNSQFILTSNLNSVHVWDTKTGKLINSISDHKEDIIGIDVSYDDKYFLTSSSDETVRIYEFKTGKLFQILKGHNGPVMSAKFSPDGKSVHTYCNFDNSLRVFELSTAKEIFLLQDDDKFFTYSQISADGLKILIVQVEDAKENDVMDANKNWSVKIFDIINGDLLFKYTKETKDLTASFSQDFNYVFIKDSIDKIFEISTQKEVNILKNTTHNIKLLNLSPDGKVAFLKGISEKKDTFSGILDVNTSAIIYDLTKYKLGDYSFLSKDGKKLVCINPDNTIKVFDLTNGKLSCTIENTYLDDSPIFDPLLTFSDNSKYFLVRKRRIFTEFENSEKKNNIKEFENDFDEVEIMVYNTESGKLQLTTSRGVERAFEEVFSKDSRFLVKDYNYRKVIIYDIFSGKIAHVLGNGSQEIEYTKISPDNKTNYSVINNQLLLWDLYSGNNFKTPSQKDQSINLETFNFSKDGESLHVVNNSEILILDKKDFKIKKRIAKKDTYIQSAVLSPNNKLAFVVKQNDQKHYAEIFDIKSGKLMYNIGVEIQDFERIAFSEDSKFAMYEYIGEVYVYNMSNGKKVQSTTNEYKSIIKNFIKEELPLSSYWAYNSGFINFFSEDGMLKIELSGFQDYARIYNSANNEFMFEIRQDGKLNFLQVTTDGKYILSYGNDHKTILWDVKTGKKLYTRIVLENGDWIVYDNDYHYDGSEGAINKIYYVCGMDIINPADIKESLFVPNLVQRIMSGENLEKLPGLKDLKVCKN